MKSLLHRISKARETNIGSQLIIISDANDLFINASLRSLVTPVEPDKIITNTAVVPTDNSDPARNYIQIKPYETQKECPICPINLCKGTALLKHIAEQGPFEQVFYSGDGAVRNIHN